MYFRWLIERGADFVIVLELERYYRKVSQKARVGKESVFWLTSRHVVAKAEIKFFAFKTSSFSALAAKTNI
jgi:hypothetical protein